MRRFVSLIGLILASILVGLVVMEVVLRLFGISYPNFTIANEWTGFSLRPGAAGWVNDEGKAYISINSGGMRDREHAIAKPPSTIGSSGKMHGKKMVSMPATNIASSSDGMA
jgi:hypothetical protein